MDKDLPLTAEMIKDPEGRLCPVLDVKKLDFSSAPWGRKKQSTHVRKALEGEKIAPKFEGGKETFDYVAKAGEAVFVNDEDDEYVPPAGDGSEQRLQFDDLEKAGYQIEERLADGSVRVKSPVAQLLVGVVGKRICIKNAWGGDDLSENHQFLSAGATLKKSLSGTVTGMDAKGFEKWELLAKRPRALRHRMKR